MIDSCQNFGLCGDMSRLQFVYVCTQHRNYSMIRLQPYRCLCRCLRWKSGAAYLRISRRVWFPLPSILLHQNQESSFLIHRRPRDFEFPSARLPQYQPACLDTRCMRDYSRIFESRKQWHGQPDVILCNLQAASAILSRACS